MEEKSKILIIGGTGYIGKYLVKESVKCGHSTFILVRESTLANPEKSKLIDTFKSIGVALICVCNHNSTFFHKILFFIYKNLTYRHIMQHVL